MQTLLSKKNVVEDKVQTLPASIQNIIQEIYANRQTMTNSHMRKIVLESKVEAADLMPWASFNHSLTDSYGRKLVYEDDFFEIMVMSWVPGDTSAIHDHGHTQWGAVKVFGSAEHATFLVENDTITTLARTCLISGQVLSVGNRLIHQMANTSKERFLTLHIYGVHGEGLKGAPVTENARIWDITQGVIQHTSGGVFFALPDKDISSCTVAPKPDFLSWLHNTVESLYRVRKARHESTATYLVELEKYLIKQLYDTAHWDQLNCELMEHVDDNGHITDSRYWELLRDTLIRASNLQSNIFAQTTDSEDLFHTYAELYDEVIGRQCLNSFTSKYIQFFHDKYKVDFPASKILSIGCGTGIMEKHILDTYNVSKDNLLGIDISPAMIEVATEIIQAKVQDILEYDDATARWNICFASLNVFQYLPQPMLEKAIANTARITKSGGYFVGDFITPDHMRWYPNIMRSDAVISLRQPELIEQDHNMLVESDIINVSKMCGKMRITYEGKHTRYLPSLWKMRYLFEKYFAEHVDIYDAVTLEPLLSESDTSPSTRYLVVARKKSI